MATKAKLDYKKTILIGFGFMATSIAWAIYDPYVTKILNRLLTESPLITSWSEALISRFPDLVRFAEAQGEAVEVAGGGFTLVPLFIGIIMTFDNLFGVIFQPTFGKLSDRCHSKLGKRRPFIVSCAPISAVLFFLIPIMSNVSLSATMVAIILFVFSMSLWRAPVVALMPDLTPTELRSEGNAVINLMGGAGSLVGLVAGTLVVAIYGAVTGLPSDQIAEEDYFPYVFLIGSIIMLLGMLVLLFFVKEPDSRLTVAAEKNMAADEKARRQAEKEARKAEKAKIKAEKLSTGERVSLIFMLLGLFFLFCGTNAITTFFSLFAAEVLGKTTSEATIMMGVFAVFSAVGAIPAGYFGKKIGRKKTILLGLALFMAVFVLYLITRSMALIWAALVIGGVANMFITVNTLPLVLEIGGLDKVGTFTGYYYTATFSAQIASPIVYGIVRMFTGTYMSLFAYCPVVFVLAILCILFVRHGEALPDEVIEKAREEED